MKNLILAGILATCASVSAQADTILGLYVGAYAWQTGISGDVDDGAVITSIEDDLDVDDETNSVLYAALEHPIPALPNIRLTQTSLEFEGTDDINDTEVDLDISHTDVTLYYEVLDNVVSLDIGLAARMYDGELGDDTGAVEVDETQALAYALVRGDLPFTGLAIGAELYAGEGSTTDANIYLEYETSIGFGFAGGFRSLATDIEADDDLTADLTIDGGYLSIFYHL